MSSFYFGSSKVEANDKKEENTKVSVSIIGDAFVDLFCYMNDGSESESSDRSLLKLGGDVRINQPVKPVAGGSGVNTATHLTSLVKKFPFSKKEESVVVDDAAAAAATISAPSTATAATTEENVEAEVENENGKEGEEEEEEEQIDVTLQTVVNENDDYGQLLISHAKSNNFEMINCRRTTNATTENASTDEQQQQQNDSANAATGHCIVLVTKNERSFITHLGIMESFRPSHTILHELVQCRTAKPEFKNHHHHIHIAGYYNVPKFHSKNGLKKRINLIREKRRTQSHGKLVHTTTISLTPQYDATEKWSTVALFNLLPLVDFLILNLVEACKICKIALSEEGEEDGGDALNRIVLLRKLADLFDEQSPQTYVIITLGKHGAVLLYAGEIVHTHSAPMKYDTPVDATGAGDAFVSGFIFGTMNWRRERQHNQVHEIGSVLEEAGGWTDAIENGMEWGCATGTACVMKAGASAPSSKEEIESLLDPKFEDKSENEKNDDNEEDSDSQEDSESESESESEYDSEFDSDYIADLEDSHDSELDSDYIADEEDSELSSSFDQVEYYEDEDSKQEKKRWV